MTQSGRSFSLFQKLGRLIKYRLVIPLIRSPHPPEYKARGVAIGMAWAMTPLVGIQMWLVFMTWAFLRKVFKWHFSLPLALAYTWVTNVFTMVPVYYGFYVTGQIMRGNGAHIRGYQNLKHIIETTFLADYDFYQKWALFFKLLLKDWGVSMAVGCIPWAVVFGIGSYYATMKYERMRVVLREKRLKKVLERERAARQMNKLSAATDGRCIVSDNPRVKMNAGRLNKKGYRLKANGQNITAKRKAADVLRGKRFQKGQPAPRRNKKLED